MEYYQFLFKALPPGKKDVLIALLNDIGFTGFEEEDDNLKAFISKDDLNETDLANTISQTGTVYTRSVIEEINWNEKWESGFEPVTILHPGTAAAFVYLRAGFHPPTEMQALDIVITPKMSFGTGHHPTTYLMIEQMSKIDFAGKTVIDFGTGTAVLAILAEKLGAAKIFAIDNDDWSINNANENIAANNCERISVVKADNISSIEKGSIILANINLNIITENLPTIKSKSLPGTTVLFSGIMEHDQPLIEAALGRENITIKKILHKNGWIAILTEL